MRKQVLIGLDLGTTNAKATGFQPDGEVVAEASCGYPTHFPRPGWAEQCPSDWQAALVSALRQVSASLGARTRQVAGIGLSAHAPGLVLVDVTGQPLVKCCPTWQDERSRPQGLQLLKEVGPGWVGLGMPFAAFAAKLRWTVEEQPEVATKARYALGVRSYVASWLTGHFATDPSSEPGNEEARNAIRQACDWSLDRLPSTLPPTAVVGGLKPDRAADLGLPGGLPVVMGLNDGASATLGNGALRPGDSVITLATNGVVFLVSAAPVPPRLCLDHALFCWPYVEDRWIVGGQTKCGAASLQWLVNLLGGVPQHAGFDTLLAEAVQCPRGSGGVVFLPYLMGRGTPRDDPNAQGAFLGLTLGTRRANLCRAVLEGVVFSLREICDDFVQLGIAMNTAFVAGGGAQSLEWRQIVADVLNRPVIYCAADSCRGAAILASVALGFHPDIETAVGKMTRHIGESLPLDDAIQVYEQLYVRYCRLRDALAAPRVLEDR